MQAGMVLATLTGLAVLTVSDVAAVEYSPSTTATGLVASMVVE